MLFQCWASVEDGGPILKQHWVNASCLLGCVTKPHAMERFADNNTNAIRCIPSKPGVMEPHCAGVLISLWVINSKSSTTYMQPY